MKPKTKIRSMSKAARADKVAVRPGQKYCDLTIRLPLVVSEHTDTEYIEKMIELYLSSEVETIAKYAASRAIDPLQIDARNVRWELE